MTERTAEHQPENFLTTSTLLEIASCLWPDRTAIVFGDRSITYKELQQESTRLARGLRELGLGSGDNVAIISANCPEYLTTYFAASAIGARLVPLNFRSNLDQLHYMLEVTRPKLLFYGDRNREIAQAATANRPERPHLVSLQTRTQNSSYYPDLLIDGAELDQPDTTAEDTTIIMFTSGTTSLPKAVEQPHRSFTADLPIATDPESEETIMITTPLFHVAAMQGVFASVAEGRTMVLLPNFRIESILSAIERGVSRITLVPTQLEQLVNHPDLTKYDLNSLRQITYGGSHIPLSVILKAIAALPNVAFFRAYGLTETGGTVAVLGPGDHRVGNEYRLTYSIGHPLPDTQIKIIDEDGRLIPPRASEQGPLGRIAIKTKRAMEGYLGRPEQTRGTLTDDGFILTQDLGWQDLEDYVYCLARADDMIIRGGEKIPPGEIESALLSHPSVADAVAFGIPNEEWGQVIGVAIVPQPGVTIDEATIIAFCQERLGSSKTPARIIIKEELPRNALGKVLRSQLQQEIKQ